MKAIKKKFLLLMAMIPILALLVTGVIFMAAAESAGPTVSIERFNLTFENNIYIKYAVKLNGVTSVDKNNFKLLIWTEPQAAYEKERADVVLSSIGTQTIDGEEYHIFAYTDLAAKQMTDDVYARAYFESDGKIYYSDVEKYSILQYAYNKLGKTGEATTNENLKLALQEMLEYGAAMQNYFGYKTDCLATAEFYQVKVEGGMLADGTQSGLFLAGEKVTLTAPEANDFGEPFLNWKDENEAIVSKVPTFVVDISDANCQYIACYGACEHAVVMDPAVAPTCTGTGLTEGSHCSVCDEVLVPQEVVAATGHTEVLDPAVAPTCTESGLAEGSHCSVCDEVLVPQEVVAATGHTEVLDPAVAPTCTGTGLTEGSHCAGCNTLMIAQNEIAALGHTEAIGAAVAPTCTETGDTEFKYCSVCHTMLVWPTSVPATGHQYDNACDATCNVCAATRTVADHNYDEDGICTICGTDPHPDCSKGLEYSINLDYSTYSVVGIGTCTDTDIVVPRTYKGKNVTKIGASAFSKCKSIKSIDLPYISSIGSSAFWACTSLTTVEFNGTQIGERAFQDCSSLSSITFSNMLESIESYAFNDCTSLTSVTIDGYSLTSIGDYAFSNCTALTSIYIPHGHTSIGKETFASCRKLTDVRIDFMKSIGEYAFKSCTSLKSIEIPGNVTSIGDYAFISCSALESITIGANVKNISYQVFAYCYALKDITVSSANTTYKSDNNCIIEIASKKLVLGCKNSDIPTDGSVTSIGQYAFYHCTGLTDITIPSSIKSIAGYAFSGCTGLTSVTISDSVTNIYAYAFNGCTNLTIYARAASKPTGWVTNWNPSNRPVVWGYTQ